MIRNTASRSIAAVSGEPSSSAVATGTLAALATILFFLITALPVSAQTVRPPDNAVTNAAPPQDGANPANVPSKVKTQNADHWRGVRSGVRGNVSIPDKKAGVLVQSQGEEWRQTRTAVLPRYGSYALFGVLFALATFYLIRGRIKISRGLSGRTIERFTDIERMGHWLMAVSFIILGLTGLNLIYGKEVLMPLLGKDLFASMTALGKWLHNYIAFAFMAGLVMTFVFWLRHNIPNSADVRWLAEGGGMFSKNSHPPARKFNAGQKILFWLIMLSGLSISLSGLALLFPFQFSMFGPTFALLNVFGFDLPTNLARVEEMQYAALWHGIVGLFMMCIIIAHIYIGSIGMEGAFDAMGSGQVDENWAREHHNLWAEEVLGPDPDAGHGNAAAGGEGAAKPGDGTPEAAT